MKGQLTLVLVYLCSCVAVNEAAVPVVINTWAFQSATRTAWKTLLTGASSLDAVENGCTRCEQLQCDGTVGFGGSPDENGESTLDAMIMYGPNRKVGAVAQLRRIKDAMRVARKVLDHTAHTLLVGDLATDFAKMMGFNETDLSTDTSRKIHKEWKDSKCQPNYWTDVSPDPKTSCGPYTPAKHELPRTRWDDGPKDISRYNHDTIGMIAIDKQGIISGGTSTNGMTHKIPGRVGDSPIPGAGAYVDQDVGGAAATGDGDIMMRFLPAYQAVEFMRQGITPTEACRQAMHRITKLIHTFQGGLVCVDMQGQVGAACHGLPMFPYSTVSDETKGRVVVVNITCEGSDGKTW